MSHDAGGHTALFTEPSTPTLRVTCRPLAHVSSGPYERLVGRSFFASAGFLDLWRTMGGRPVVWQAEIDGALIAVLPGVEYGVPPILRFASLPDGCYGGLFVDPELRFRRAEIGRAILDTIAARRYAKTSVFDFRATLAPHHGFDTEPCESRLVYISDPDWQPPDPCLRSEIRKADRNHLHIVPFDRALHERPFLDLVTATARRHGQKVRYRPRFFQVLADLALRDSRVRWLFCAHEGLPVASHIYFVEHDTLQFWQSYYDKRFSSLKANQYMMFTLCREMAHRGVRWLNLGSTPPGAAGLEYFKSHWGGSLRHFRRYSRWEGLGALLHRRQGARAAQDPQLA